MNRPKTSIAMIAILIASMLLASSAATFAADAQASMPAPSKEMREKMAALHEKMAACLRSEKPLAACRQEMQTSCSHMMGEQGCPTMGMHGRMTRPQQPEQ